MIIKLNILGIIILNILGKKLNYKIVKNKKRCIFIQIFKKKEKQRIWFMNKFIFLIIDFKYKLLLTKNIFFPNNTAWYKFKLIKH